MPLCMQMIFCFFPVIWTFSAFSVLLLRCSILFCVLFWKFSRLIVFFFFTFIWCELKGGTNNFFTQARIVSGHSPTTSVDKRKREKNQRFRVFLHNILWWWYDAHTWKAGKKCKADDDAFFLFLLLLIFSSLLLCFLCIFPLLLADFFPICMLSIRHVAMVDGCYANFLHIRDKCMCCIGPEID